MLDFLRRIPELLRMGRKPKVQSPPRLRVVSTSEGGSPTPLRGRGRAGASRLRALPSRRNAAAGRGRTGMPINILMPALSPTMEKGNLANGW
jgi:hypothetical protein